jgi:hypothetical protein
MKTTATRKCLVCGSDFQIEEHHLIPKYWTGGVGTKETIPLCRKHHRFMPPFEIQVGAGDYTAQSYKKSLHKRLDQMKYIVKQLNKKLSSRGYHFELRCHWHKYKTAHKKRYCHIEIKKA